MGSYDDWKTTDPDPEPEGRPVEDPCTECGGEVSLAEYILCESGCYCGLKCFLVSRRRRQEQEDREQEERLAGAQECF